MRSAKSNNVHEVATVVAKSFLVRDPNYVERIKDAFGRQGFLRYVDARIEELAPGRCVIAADFRSELAQQNGYLSRRADRYDCRRRRCMRREHVDRKSAVDAHGRVQDQFSCARQSAQLKAVGEVVRAGRTLTVSQVNLYGVDEAGEEQLCALATVTLMTLATPGDGK